MSLKETLQDELKEAMRSQNATARTAIRGALTAINETEQRQREDLVKKALAKHKVQRPPHADDADAMAAYEQTIQSVMEQENVEAESLLDDAGVQGLIQKLIKQQQDSIADAQRAGRSDLIASAEAEIAVLEAYLPRQLSRAEIEREAQAIIEQTGASGIKEMGKVMGPLMGRLQGKADGKLVSEVVRGLLTG